MLSLGNALDALRYPQALWISACTRHTYAVLMGVFAIAVVSWLGGTSQPRGDEWGQHKAEAVISSAEGQRQGIGPEPIPLSGTSDSGKVFGCPCRYISRVQLLTGPRNLRILAFNYPGQPGISAYEGPMIPAISYAWYYFKSRHDGAP